MALMEMCPPPHPRGWLAAAFGRLEVRLRRPSHSRRPFLGNRTAVTCRRHTEHPPGGLPDAAWVARRGVARDGSGPSFLRSANMIDGPSTSEPAANLESTAAASARDQTATKTPSAQHLLSLALSTGTKLVFFVCLLHRCNDTCADDVIEM